MPGHFRSSLCEQSRAWSGELAATVSNLVSASNTGNYGVLSGFLRILQVSDVARYRRRPVPPVAASNMI